MMFGYHLKSRIDILLERLELSWCFDLDLRDDEGEDGDLLGSDDWLK